MSDNLDIFKEIMLHNNYSTIVNKQKQNLLHVACMLGRESFISILIQQGISATDICDAKRTPLERAAEVGHVGSMKQLLQSNTMLKATLLPFAATFGRLELINELLTNNGQSLHIDSRDNTGQSALMKACELGKEDIVKYLLQKGASVTTQDLQDKTSLHYACEKGHENVVKILLEHNVEINVQDKYTGSELCFLIRGKDQDQLAWYYVEVRRNVVEKFLRKTKQGQVDPAQYGTVVKSGFGANPDVRIVQSIGAMFADRRNVNTNSENRDMTPLHLATLKQHPKIVKMLIEHGADVNVKEKNGLTPYMLCAVTDNVELAAELVSNGANTEEKDKQGNTPLQIATLNDSLSMKNFIESERLFDLYKNI